MFATYRTRIFSVPSVIDDLAGYLQSGFITRGVGIWRGNREDAAVLDLVGEDSEIDRIIGRANRLASSAGEDSILATVTETNAAIITATGERLPVIGSILTTIR